MTHTIPHVHIGRTRRPAVPHTPRKSMRTAIGWAAVILGLVTAVTLAVVAITQDSTPQRVETEQTAVNNSRAGVPMSPDAAERLFAGESASLPLGVPLSADGAEHWLAGSGAPVGVPSSADGAERWLANNK